MSKTLFLCQNIGQEASKWLQAMPNPKIYRYVGYGPENAYQLSSSLRITTLSSHTGKKSNLALLFKEKITIQMVLVGGVMVLLGPKMGQALVVARGGALTLSR